MQMSGIERLEMMGDLTVSIVSHVRDTSLTVRSKAELSAGNLSTTGQWPAAFVAAGLLATDALQRAAQRGGSFFLFSAPQEGANQTLETYSWTSGEEEGL